MDLAGGGRFVPGDDHSFLTMYDGERAGGFVVADYTGNAMQMHVGSVSKRWLSRTLIWLAFDYPFRQIGCGKVLSPVRSDNLAAFKLTRRLGALFETRISDVYAPGVDMLVLSMTREACPWLTPPRVATWKAGVGIDG
jgi:hypothetical protein